MRFLRADDLFAQRDYVRAEGVERSGGEVVTIVDGVDCGERILWRKNVVDAGSTEVFADGLQRAAEDLGDAVEVGDAWGRRWPKIQERLDSGDGGGARGSIRNEGGGGLAQKLAEAFVVGE